MSRSASSALVSAIASSIASRVPEPMEKCAECKASPISTIFLNDQRSFQIQGKLRHTDLFDTRESPSSVDANTCSQMAFDCSTVLSAKPQRCHVAKSHSTRKVLMPGEYR